MAPSVALGDVAIRSATPRKPARGFLNPFRHQQCPAPVWRFTFLPSSMTSSIPALSPWSFNYQQSVFGHVPQSSRSAIAGRLLASGFLNAMVNYDLCAKPGAGHEISKLTSFDVSLSAYYLPSSATRGENSPYV